MANTAGALALFRKEVRRFLKVWLQTVLTPMITVVLYLMVFSHVLAARVVENLSVPYAVFLVPGLIMMSVIQNAFANSSSSLIQSKVNGSLTFLLLSPISAFEIWLAYVAAAVVRALLCGGSVLIAALFFVDLPISNALWILAFATLAGAALGSLGIIGGVAAQKFDHLAAFTNFVILPLSFLSGVFYSLHSLPEFWQSLSRFNPFFYMIDGLRYGFLGVADVSPWQSLAVVAGFMLLACSACLLMLQRGYRLRT